MANNRIWMRCTICDAVTLLAKFYPSTGWYVWTKNLDDKPEITERFNKFFLDHEHGKGRFNCGPTHFAFEYETPEMFEKKHVGKLDLKMPWEDEDFEITDTWDCVVKVKRR